MHGSESFLYHLDPLVFLFLLPILGFINEGRIEPQSQEGVLENSVPPHSRKPKCSWGFFRGEVAVTCMYSHMPKVSDRSIKIISGSNVELIYLNNQYSYKETEDTELKRKGTRI